MCVCAYTLTHTHAVLRLAITISVCSTGPRRRGQENHPANQEGHRRQSGPIRSDVGAVQACSWDSQVTAAPAAAVSPRCVHRNPTRS